METIFIFAAGFLGMGFVVLLSIVALDCFCKSRSEVFDKLFYIVIAVIIITGAVLIIVSL
jgi:hypothetical protein